MKGVDICEQSVELCIEFPRFEGNTTVFIGKLALTPIDLGPYHTHKHRELYLFGGKVKDGFHPKYGDLFRIGYIVIERDLLTQKLIKHILMQHQAVMFKRREDATTVKAYDKLKPDELPCFDLRPVWDSSKASWPFMGNQPFLFLRQIYIPENATTLQYFTWDRNVFLFAFVTSDDLLMVQVFSEEAAGLTPEGQYWLERQIAEFERSYTDIDVVRKLICKSDKFFQEYLLQSDKVDNEVLSLLVKYGKTKAIVEQAQKRFK